MRRDLLSDERGAVAILTALALPVLIASAALACEVGYWVVETRSLQNAADAAAVSAAFAGGTGFAAEAAAVAAAHGFVDGAGGVTVSTAGVVGCFVAGGCYRVTIARPSVSALSGLSPRLSATSLASATRKALVQ